MEILPHILCIDTGTSLCSVALTHGTQVLVEEVDRAGDKRHAALLPLLIEKARRKTGIGLHELNAIACSLGPGSYTGLRVGLSTVKGLCLALNKPMIGVSTLKALTYSLSIAPLPNSCRVITMIDAGRNEVYHGVFDHDHSLIVPVGPLILFPDSFHSFFEKEYELYLIGDGTIKAKKILLPHPRMHFGEEEIRASMLCIPALRKYVEGNFEDLALSVPEYIKAPDYKKYV